MVLLLKMFLCIVVWICLITNAILWNLLYIVCNSEDPYIIKIYCFVGIVIHALKCVWILVTLPLTFSKF